VLTLHADADGCRGGVIQWAFDYVTLNDGINTAPVYPYVGQASALEYVVGLCLFLETSVRLEALLQFLTRNGLYTGLRQGIRRQRSKLLCSQPSISLDKTNHSCQKSLFLKRYEHDSILQMSVLVKDSK